MKIKNRPLSIHLSSYSWQISSNLSILHRFSAILVYLFVINIICYLFLLNNILFVKINFVYFILSILYLYNYFFLLFLYHSLNGIRFILNETINLFNSHNNLINFVYVISILTLCFLTLTLNKCF